MWDAAEGGNLGRTWESWSKSCRNWGKLEKTLWGPVKTRKARDMDGTLWVKEGWGVNCVNKGRLTDERYECKKTGCVWKGVTYHLQPFLSASPLAFLVKSQQERLQMVITWHCNLHKVQVLPSTWIMITWPRGNCDHDSGPSAVQETIVKYHLFRAFATLNSHWKSGW